MVNRSDHHPTDSIIKVAAATAAVATADDDDADTARCSVSVGVTARILEMYVFCFHYRRHYYYAYHIPILMSFLAVNNITTDGNVGRFLTCRKEAEIRSKWAADAVKFGENH